MRRKGFLAVSLVAMLGLTLVGCGNEKGASPAAEDNTFVVGMEANYPPYNWSQLTDANGAVPIDGSSEYAGGYDVEVAKLVAEGLGKELVIVKSEWDSLIPSIQTGKIDAIIAGMSPTAKRKETIDFSESYYDSQIVMVVHSQGPYANATSLEDFANAKITAQLNTFHYGLVDQVPGAAPQEAMIDFATMRVSLLAGKIDAYISERPEGLSAEMADSNYKMIVINEGFELVKEERVTAIGLPKDSDLVDDINKILANFSADERDALMDEAMANQPLLQ